LPGGPKKITKKLITVKKKKKDWYRYIYILFIIRGNLFSVGGKIYGRFPVDLKAKEIDWLIGKKIPSINRK
jgi:hypothetical protein